MIISRTPFRISFFGGGTDYPAWFQKRGGAVLSTTFDKYSYITCRHLPPFFDHQYRVSYSQIEHAKEIRDIEHRAVSAVLQEMDVQTGLEIHCDADLPARSGLGSSSSFVVGLLNTLSALNGKRVSRHWLAQEAIRIEKDVLQETVGAQDQIAAAYGGFNVIHFLSSEEARHKNPEGNESRNFQVEPVIVVPERKNLLNNHLMLFFTGFSRIASQIAQSKVAAFDQKEKELTRMRQMVDDALDVLSSEQDIRVFGELLHEAWMHKRELSTQISNSHIDDFYKKARDAGAIGGKLIGAGGGGFMLFFAEPECQAAVKKVLYPLVHVPFLFESSGSQIIYYQP